MAVKATNPRARRLIVQHWRESQVRGQIISCNACALGTSNRVPFTGSTWQPDLVLLGEAPGANEDRAGKPFVGRAGRLLDEMLVRAGTSYKQCVITNSACCRPPSNRDPSWSELSACEANRVAQIRLARTVVGVTLGRIALAVLKDDPTIKIGPNRSQPFWALGKVWVPTYHPAYALRNAHAEPQIIADLKLAVDLARGAKELPIDPSWPDWEIYGDILVVRDESIQVPTKLVEVTVIYTREEWARIHYHPEVQPAITTVKKAIGASVVK